MTSQMMMALSPSVNSCGEGAFVKVIFSGYEMKTFLWLNNIPGKRNMEDSLGVLAINFFYLI